MDLLPKVNCSPVMSWTRRPVCPENTVIPIQINVKTRGLNTGVVENKTPPQVSVFTVENEIRQHKRHGNFDGNTRRHEKCEAFEISPLPTIAMQSGRSSSSIDCDSILNQAVWNKVRVRESDLISPLPMVSIDDEPTKLNDRAIDSGRVTVKHNSINCEPSSYMHTHFKIMYFFGISAYRTHTTGTRQDDLSDDHKKILEWVYKKLHLVLFSVNAFFSALKSFCDAKYALMWFLFEGGLNGLVKLAFHFTHLITSVYASYILCHKWDSVRKMVHIMSSYEQDWTARCKMAAFPVALSAVTVTWAFLKSSVVVYVSDFSAKKSVLYAAHEISEDLFIWSSTNLNITTEQLEIDYGTQVNTITTGLAVTNVVVNFAYSLQEGMLWDLFGNAILSMSTWIFAFMVLVNQVKENAHGENSNDDEKMQRKRILVWKMYRAIRILFEAVNDVFGPLLFLFHVTNVVRYAFFMEYVIYHEGEPAFRYIELLYNIVKSEIIYMLASKIEEQNDIIRKWLHNWALYTGKINLGNTQLDINVVLDELNKEPLGFGKGNYAIDQRFHFGLLGMVCSLFVMLVNKTGMK